MKEGLETPQGIESSVVEICRNHAGDRSRLLDIAREVQARFRCVSQEAIALIASELSIPEVEVESVATYPEEPLLLSGWMIGDERLRERAAALDISYGEGRVLAFGFNVHNRAQARSTMKLLFNALLYR